MHTYSYSDMAHLLSPHVLGVRPYFYPICDLVGRYIKSTRPSITPGPEQDTGRKKEGAGKARRGGDTQNGYIL